jgi:hypothetical protein
MLPAASARSDPWGTVMDNTNTWELPFGVPAELELHTEWGSLSLVPVEAGREPRLELTRGTAENIAVHVEKHGNTVRVALEPQRNFHWFGGWECRATLYVPLDVRAHLQTNAGSVNVHGLEGCELGVKANAGKIELEHVHGVLHLAADAGSVQGRDVGGWLDVETQAGSVRLEVSELQAGEHRIRAAMGSVRVELAKGMDVCIETHTSLGSVHNNFPSHQAAPARLILTTEMGSLRVDEGRLMRGPSRPANVASAAQYPPTQTRAQPPAETANDPELERILKMVEAGELSAKEADELLQALGRA